ncbi:glycoside hydrolase 64/thaumatin family protein [Halothiobacillus diazotrophicus]|nr:hypothetical protein [Halothiobacillus diazotrophicus]
MTGAMTRALLVTAVIFLTGCQGSGTSNSTGTIQIGSDSVEVRAGEARTVPVTLSGNNGGINRKITLSVADPTIAYVAPNSCVLSSGADPCTVTVFGKQAGSTVLLAEADGYARSQVATSVTPPTNPYGTISVTSATQSFYSGASIGYPFSITVQLTPATGTTSKKIPNDNPLTVLMNPVPGISYANGGVQQCALTTDAPTCTLSGTIDATLVTSKKSFTTTIQPTGSWVAGVNAPFGPQDNVTITWNGNPDQSPGTIHVASQNGSGQIYLGMKAPLFVYLKDDTLAQSAYWVTVTSQDPSALVFYAYPDGSNSPSSMQTMPSVTCALALDNTSPASYASSVTSCGYGLLPLKGTAAGLDASLSVAVTLVPPSQSNNQVGLLLAMPNFPKTVNLKLMDNSALTTGRTITFANDSTDTVAIGVNAGSANAYTAPNAVAPGVDPTNPARTKAGAQSYCGPTSNGKNACPIGSTCVQGGAGVAKGKTPYMCFWDKPAFANGTGILPPAGQPGASTTLFIPQWSGITTGPQQIQWSGNYYVQQCPGGNCPASIETPGTGPAYAANSLAEVTYQHNTVDYYDVSIINGANYGLAFGPTDPVSTAKNYACGTPGERVPPMGVSATLPNSSWAFAPTTASFPPGQTTAVSDSPSSYFAIVDPGTAPTPTPCTTQSICTSTTGSSGPVCGWNKSKVLSGQFTFAAAERVCGNFVSWATADQIWGWNGNQNTQYLNQAPFDFTTQNAISPPFNGQSSIAVSDLQLCINNSFSAYTDPAPTGQPAVMACGGTNWAGITTPAVTYTTQGPAWVKDVLPTITWLKQACPTCYTYPFDDMSSTFTCEKDLIQDGSNNQNYTIRISNTSDTFN